MKNTKKTTQAAKERRSILEMAKCLARIQKASPGVYDVTFRMIAKGRVEQLAMVRVGEDESER